VPYLKKIGIKSIDLLVGTHPHADHIGQFPQVLKAFPVKEVWMSGDTNTTKTFEDALDAIAASGAAYHEPRLGETYQIGSAHIEVLNPNKLTGDPNVGSVSFRLIYGDIAFMFTGDAEAPTERAIIDTGKDLHAQILKLGHHGSNTSSSLAFLLAVKPELAIWSAGVDNVYGHPSPETLDRLKRLGIKTLGTAVDGTIVVATDGKTFHVEPFNPQGAATGTPTPKAAVTQAPRASPTLSPTATRTRRPAATPTPKQSGCSDNQININTATEAELQQLTQIGPARAKELITLRPFSSIDDMARIPGVGPATVEKIKAQGLACVE
jgi:competence ComEA-like helix-hairpin-helix protein